jgi:hypothetical protein
MVGDRVPFGGAKAFAFLGDNMEQLRTFDFFELGEHLHQFLYIVTIDWAKIPEAERLEEIGGAQGGRFGQEGHVLEEVKGVFGILVGLFGVAA